MEYTDIHWNINESWTLFLDRDGTINRRLVGDYVKVWDEFEFIDGALEAIEVFTKVFGRIIIVTNQQGVGKGLMSEHALRGIHVKMLDEIMLNGGYIDEIYYCPNLKEELAECRKPDIGMALQAMRDFPEINFEKSIMIGDSISDMQFGKNVGMNTLYLTQEKKLNSSFMPFIDYCMPDLSTLSEILINKKNLKF